MKWETVRWRELWRDALFDLGHGEGPQSCVWDVVAGAVLFLLGLWLSYELWGRAFYCRKTGRTPAKEAAVSPPLEVPGHGAQTLGQQALKKTARVPLTERAKAIEETGEIHAGEGKEARRRTEPVPVMAPDQTNRPASPSGPGTGSR